MGFKFGTRGLLLVFFYDDHSADARKQGRSIINHDCIIDNRRTGKIFILSECFSWLKDGLMSDVIQQDDRFIDDIFFLKRCSYTVLSLRFRTAFRQKNSGNDFLICEYGRPYNSRPSV